jgi:hypothetical protein
MKDLFTGSEKTAFKPLQDFAEPEDFEMRDKASR